jgi:hypothetical protein
MKVKVGLRSIVWTTALTGGLWLATLNPAQSCPLSKMQGFGGTFGENFPSLNWSGLDWKNIGPLSTGIVAGLLAAGGIAYRAASSQEADKPEAETATLS